METGPSNWLSGMRQALVLRFGAKRLLVGAVVGLMLVLSVEIAWSARQQSQTDDEADHILAGYRNWRCRDFGSNAEHPPLVKLLASFPLLFSHLHEPAPLCGSGPPSLKSDYVTARKFLYSNDADRILFEARCFSGILTLILAWLVFEAAREMFGIGPALLALTIFVFDPNLLANGALVTTDTVVACFLFAAVFAFYRYVKKPGAVRLVVTGIAAGLALVSKLSGGVIFLWLGVLALVDIVLWHFRQDASTTLSLRLKQDIGQAARLAGALFAISAIAFVTLWASYGFRFAARPGGESILPAPSRSQVRTGVVLSLAQHHIVPEGYYYGLLFQSSAVTGGRQTFLLGKMYPHGQWFYFPVTFVIKSTIGFLLLILIAALARSWYRKEIVLEVAFLCIPLLSYTAACMMSGTNWGLRYLLPSYPFLIILTAAGAWSVAARHKVWAYIVLVLVIFHVVSSLKAAPHYLPYCNELWGGPSQAYRVVSDSNADWGQDLKATKEYLDRSGAKNCWLAYPQTADPHYYGIPCHLLEAWPSPEPVPETVEGTVLIGATALTGFLTGPDELNPYAQFVGKSPVANINGSVLVFRGRFYLPLVAATNHSKAALILADNGDLAQAVTEAQTAAALAANNALIRATLARILVRAQHPAEARAEYETALSLAQTVQPAFQKSLAVAVRQELRSLPPDSVQ